MNKKWMSLGWCAGLLLVSSAQAMDLRLSADVGTTGLGFYAATPLAQNWIGRIGINAFDTTKSESTSDVNYDVKLKSKTVDFLIDWYALNGNFRITSGLLYNDSKVTANGQSGANGNFTINGNTYSSAQVGSLNGNVDFRKLAPYFGIGWESNPAPARTWGFTSDFGVMFQGNPKSNLSTSGCSASAATCSQLSSDLAAENASLTSQLHGLRFYPVARIGLNYKF